MMKNSNKLSIKIWLYLVGFFIILLFFIYIIQVSLLPTYYEYVTKKEVVKTAAKVKNIVKNESDYEEELNELSYETGVCVEIYNENQNIYTNNFLHRGCLFNLNNNKSEVEVTTTPVSTADNVSQRDDITKNNTKYIEEIKNKFISQSKDKNTLIIKSDKVKNKTILYGIKLDDDNYAFFNTSLEPIENSISVLKSQFIYIVLGAFILCFIIAIVLSKVISKPIIDINNNAKKLAKGKYNMSFKTTADILEINELAETLDYVRDELERTDTLRRDLMANVSHDLKTPLTMIKAYAEMVRDLDTDDKEKTIQNLNIIIDECDRLNDLVNDILELSKIQENIEELHRENIDIIRLINNILKRYKFLEEKENYKFIFNAKDKIIVNADKQKLEQVIYNLINNAVKYTGKDKKIEIKLKEENNKLKVSIINTGKGIDKKDIKYIWDKYYKVEKKYQRSQVGSGLGLNIVKNILEQHNYEYGVISKRYIKTEFYFYINL